MAIAPMVGGVTSYTEPTHKPRILIVDDDLDILAVTKQGLEMHGYSVKTYSDPEQALSDFRPRYYDHIFLDIRMPKMNGFDLGRKIWQQEPGAPLCFFSAFEIYEDEAKKVFKDLKTKCFVKKPIRVKALVQHIQSHLQPQQNSL